MREKSADSRRSGTAFPPAGAFSFPGLLRAEKRPSPSRQQKGRGKPPFLQVRLPEKRTAEAFPAGQDGRAGKRLSPTSGNPNVLRRGRNRQLPRNGARPKGIFLPCPVPEYPSAPYVPALRRQKSLSRNGKRKKSPPARFFLLTAQAESPINPFTPRGSNSVVECNLAKVEVAGSNPVSRSSTNFVAT